MTLHVSYLSPEHYEVVLQEFVSQGMSKKKAAQEVRRDMARVAAAIRDAHFTQPWNKLPDFFDPTHHIELTVMPGPTGALVALDLDGESKGLFSVGEEFEIRFLGIPSGHTPIVVEPTADVLPFKRRAN